MTHTPQEVRFGATPKPARETRALPGCGIVRSSRSTVPASGASVCGMRLKSVDFPAPFGPISATFSPEPPCMAALSASTRPRSYSRRLF